MGSAIVVVAFVLFMAALIGILFFVAWIAKRIIRMFVYEEERRRIEVEMKLMELEKKRKERNK